VTSPRPPAEGADRPRLQKVLAQAGVASRRASEDLIAARRVRVNGEIATLGDRVDPEHDLVEVDGAPVATRSGLVHYLLNKPAGVISTADDPQGRPTVVDLVPSDPRVHPVGRLDADTEGLLLLTNDGELTHRLTHPSFGVEKEYLAEVEGEPSRAALRRLREGVALDDGPTAPAAASLVAPNLLRLTIHEGRNRQVRRMCEAVGHPVVRLVRTRIGPLAERRLAPGEWRLLEPDEVRALATATTPGGQRRGGDRRSRPQGPR
jgi:23S rRNA pseudouridine2605 synthase